MCGCNRRPRTVRRRESWRKDIEVRVKNRQWLRMVIQNKGMNAAKLAAKTGLSYQMINFLVTEKSYGRNSCSLDTAVRIAEALEWDLHDLFVPKISSIRKESLPVSEGVEARTSAA